jgi:hypothetical protein
MIKPNAALWQYLSPDQQQLASDGALLIADRESHPDERLSDYSYLVFPFAKVYEGFLKQLFRDIGAISEREYQSDHFRIGKALSPNLVRLLGAKSAYAWITRRYSAELAMSLWTMWKQGRNLVFHYFPRNIQRLSYGESVKIVTRIINTMEEAVLTTGVGSSGKS